MFTVIDVKNMNQAKTFEELLALVTKR